MYCLESSTDEEEADSQKMNRVHWGGPVARFLEPVLGAFFPNRCIICDTFIDSGCCICERCERDIEIVYPPFCPRCGAPGRGRAPGRGGDKPEGMCIQCKDLRFSFAKAESLGVYRGILRELIHQYKFEKRRGLARKFASLIIQHKRGFVEQHTVIVPVPLTLQRLSERGFNQASLVAGRIAGPSGILLLDHCLKRRGSSKPQSRFSMVSERQANLKDRFSVRERYRDAVRGQAVLVFDDVFTTGATSSACAEALKRAGAQSIDLLTIARAVKE